MLDFFVYCFLKTLLHGESSLEGLNDRVLRARSEFCLIIAELSGRRYAYITNVIPSIIFLVSSGCAWRGLFL